MILVKFEWFMRDETDLDMVHIYAIYPGFGLQWEIMVWFLYVEKGVMLKAEFSEFNEEF